MVGYAYIKMNIYLQYCNCDFKNEGWVNNIFFENHYDQTNAVNNLYEKLEVSSRNALISTSALSFTSKNVQGKKAHIAFLKISSLLYDIQFFSKKEGVSYSRKIHISADTKTETPINTPFTDLIHFFCYTIIKGLLYNYETQTQTHIHK